MKLMIAEKPSVARDIARVLGGVKRHNGYIETNTYTVTWAVGHLVTLADAHNYDSKYKKWRLEDLPIVPKPFRLKVIDSSKEQYKIVVSLLKQAEEVIVATDAGREGQLIYELIALSAGYKGQAKRLWLSSMTDEAIRDAMNHLQSNAAYKNLYYAGFARAQADWLTGINATRAITKQAGSLLTIGRVQTPTLAMIVQRDLEIQHFAPEPFYELEATFEHEKGDYKGKWSGDKRTRFDCKEDAERVLKKVQGQAGRITKLEQKVVKEQPPQLFDLTSLQRMANQRYGFTAEGTLKLAQALYETHKVLTYPRTNSRYLSKDIVPTLYKRLTAAGRTFPELLPLIPESIRPTKRVVDDSKVSDHHAILPTEKAASSTLREDERKIYELITKQTIAALLPPAQWASTTIETTIVDEVFKTAGRVLVVSGWRTIVGANDKDTHQKTATESEDAQVALPAVAKGDEVETKQVHLLSKQTKPPARFTEASLLSAMENAGRQVDDEALAEALKAHGLGTPATRASIIEKIKRDGYVQVQKKNLIATDKGRALIEAIHIDVLKSPELTGDWEHRLTQIESGTYSVSQFISEITDFTHTVVETIKQTKVDVTLDERADGRDVVGICPLCGGNVVETKTSFGCANWKAQGCKFGVWKRISGHKMTKTQVKELLVKKRTKLLKFKSKSDKAFQAHLILNPNGKVEFEFARSTGATQDTSAAT